MLRDLADGRAVMLPAENADDITWLAGVLESLIADNPKRLEMLRTGIASCAIALKLAEMPVPRS